MYRILREHDQVKERRSQARHPAHVKPELAADGPSQVWTWDITRLPGPDKGIWYHCYVILDAFSRYAVGWHVSTRETAAEAVDLIADAIERNQIAPETVHADRGTSMTSKPVSALLTDLGIIRSHSRPRQSNDNPYSEAQFKTMKYAPVFPDRFTSLAHAREFVEAFMNGYNHEHRHSGIGLHTPASVHFGTAAEIDAMREATLAKAWRDHPERFAKRPKPPQIPGQVWINKPEEIKTADTTGTTSH
jgi:transposase InsO family protein